MFKSTEKVSMMPGDLPKRSTRQAEGQQQAQSIIAKWILETIIFTWVFYWLIHCFTRSTNEVMVIAASITIAAASAYFTKTVRQQQKQEI